MAIVVDLSTLTFTNQVDIVPASGTAEIINTSIANTLAGDDIITGTGETPQEILFYGSRTVGIYNESNGTINTGSDKDAITGYGNIGIYNESNGIINTGNNKDAITGYGSQTGSSSNNTIGVLNDGTINMGSKDDIISGYATGDFPGGIVNFGIIDAGYGNDIITGDGSSGGVSNGAGGTINTSNGDDSIIGTSDDVWGVYNGGFDESGSPTINAGNGNDSIIGTTTGGAGAGIASVLQGTINTGNGDDSIVGTGLITGITCNEDGTINTGTGNDIITGTGDDNGIAIGSFSGSSSSKGTINTGDGNDVITGIGGIFNDSLGIIDTGAGKDIVDALTGGFSGDGTTKLGNNADTLKGFGSGFFEGGNGKDTLFFDTGSYTVSDNVNSDGFYTVSNGSTDMFIKDFEFISSVSDPGETFSFSSVIGETFMV